MIPGPSSPRRSERDGPIPVPAGSLGASRVHTEWTVQTDKIHTASVWRLGDWTDGRRVRHTVLQASEHAHRGAAAGVWCRKQGPSRSSPAPAQKARCPPGGSAGPSARGPGGGAAFPALLLACGFPASACVPLQGASASPSQVRERLTLRSRQAPQSAFSKTLHKKLRENTQKNAL